VPHCNMRGPGATDQGATGRSRRKERNICGPQPLVGDQTTFPNFTLSLLLLEGVGRFHPIRILFRNYSDIIGDVSMCAIILNGWDRVNFVKGHVMQRVNTVAPIRLKSIDKVKTAIQNYVQATMLPVTLYRVMKQRLQ
jgi:hypothetical protein